MRQLIPGILFALLTLSACSDEKSPAGEFPSLNPSTTSVNCPGPYKAKGPEWTAMDLDGKAVTLAKYKDKKGVLLVFFATWCPYCMEEVPDLIKFREKVKDRQIEVVGMAIEQPANVIRRFADDYKVNYTLLLDPDARTAREYKIPGVPTIYGLNRDGCVVYFGHGLPKDTEALVKALEGSGPDAPAVKPE